MVSTQCTEIIHQGHIRIRKNSEESACHPDYKRKLSQYLTNISLRVRINFLTVAPGQHIWSFSPLPPLSPSLTQLHRRSPLVSWTSHWLWLSLVARMVFFQKPAWLTNIFTLSVIIFNIPTYISSLAPPTPLSLVFILHFLFIFIRNTYYLIIYFIHLS